MKEKKRAKSRKSFKAFQKLAKRGDKQRGLRLLKKLQEHFGDGV